MIKEFLVDNYIWILVVLLLFIMTVIGFLVDKSKNKKKEAEPVPQGPAQAPMMNPSQPQMMNGQVNYNNQPVMNQGQFAQNQAPVMNSQPIPSPVQNPVQNNGVQLSDPYKNPVQTPVLMPNGMSQPIENVQAPEAYQPLSEQTPSFGSQPVQGPVPNTPVVFPTPVNSESVSVQPVQMNYNQPVTPQMQPMMNQAPIQNSNEMAGPGFMNQQPQMIPNPPVNGPIPSPMPNPGMNNTIPTPVNPQMNGGYVYNPQNNNQM